MAEPATHIGGNVHWMPIIERAVADNLRDYVIAYRRAAAHVGAELLEVAGGAAAFVGIGSPVTSAKGVGPFLRSEDLKAIEQFYARHGVLRIAIETAPWLEESSRRLLLARGYREAEREDV